MKKVLLSLLVIVLALGLLGAAGYAGYRYGFRQGMVAGLNVTDEDGPSFVPGFGLTPRGMPMHSFGFQRGFDRDGFGMMGRGGIGFGFFPFFGLLLRLLFWGLIIAGIVWLITSSGWRLTRTAPVAATTTTTTTVAETPPPAASEENKDPNNI